MRLKRPPLSIIILSGLTIFPLILFHFVPRISIWNNSNLTTENDVVIPHPEQVSFGLPVRLKIPTINVDAFVEHAGLTADGAMDVPKGLNNVSWFNLGPHPGEKGSAVIAGHFGLKNIVSSVFDSLHKLNIGDEVYIEDEKGQLIIFVVRETQIYGKDDDASPIFISSDDKAHLNLITCTGAWNQAKRTYADRLVVFTDKE